MASTGQLCCFYKVQTSLLFLLIISFQGTQKASFVVVLVGVTFFINFKRGQLEQGQLGMDHDSFSLKKDLSYKKT